MARYQEMPETKKLAAIREKRRRLVLHIVPGSEYGWAIKQEREGVLATRETKADAIKLARKWARDNRPSQIKVHGKNGRIQTEWTYGDDPRRYKG